MASANVQTVKPELTDELKANLRAANPGIKLHPVRIGGQIIVLRKPERIAWERYESERDKGERDVEAALTLVKTCVVYPDEPAFEKLLEDKYAIYQPLGDVIGKLVGLERVEELDTF